MHAEAFWQGTRDHDVSQNIAALLQHIEARAPFTILDLGCGPGRDLVAFAGLGHVAVGVEGAANLAAMARANSGCEVWQQDLLALDLPQERFDGVFANAVLFHVPSQELPRVLRQLHETLKPGGVLFSSNPRGRNEEGWQRRALWRLSRSRSMATISGRGRLRGAGPLLPSDRTAIRAAALAGERLAAGLGSGCA